MCTSKHDISVVFAVNENFNVSFDGLIYMCLLQNKHTFEMTLKTHLQQQNAL